MDKNSLIKIINKELTIVSELIGGFSSSEQIHPFEIDLALARIKDIYGELQLLKDSTKTIIENISDKEPVKLDSKNRNNNVLGSEENTSSEIIDKVDLNNDKEIKQEQINIIEEEDTKEELPAEETKEKLEKEENLELEQKQMPEEEEEEEEEELEILEIETIQEKELEPEPKEKEQNTKHIDKERNSTSIKKKSESLRNEIIADKFDNMSPSINDMISEFKKGNSLANSITNKPLSKLKTAIKLNDKIWFINELFDKDADLYNTTIDSIDNSENLDQAMSILFPKFNWNQDKKSTVSFLELVFRRFS